MKIIDFLRMDCRLPVNMVKLKKAVNMTKWFERFDFEQLNIDVLEEGYNKVAKKFECRIGYIMRASEDSWCIMVKEESGKWINTIYCNKFEEGMCKVILTLYGYYIKGQRYTEEDKNNKKR